MEENMRAFIENWNECLKAKTQEILQTDTSMREFFEYLIRERSNHTVFNKIMIRAYCPQATDVRPKETWENMNITIAKPDEAIWTMRYHGKEWGFYPQLEYDISATSAAEAKLPDEKLPADYVMELLLADPIAKLSFVNIGSQLKAYYNDETKTITYTGGFTSYDEICTRFFREYVHALLHADDYHWKQMEWVSERMEGTLPYRYERARKDPIATIAVFLLETRYGTRHMSSSRFCADFETDREAREYIQAALSAANRITFHLQDVERRLKEEDAAREKAEKGG